MTYHNGAEALQAVEDWANGGTGTAARLADANINPVTGLATDYLNHFSEAIMLLEMLSSCSDCTEEFLAWRPLSYREHFSASHFKDRQLAIEAYETADPALRGWLDTITGTMTAALVTTGVALRSNPPPEAAAALAESVSTWLKSLVARAGAVINGENDMLRAGTAQADVDVLMNR